MDMTIEIDGAVCGVSVGFDGYIANDTLSQAGEDYVRAVIAAMEAARDLATRSLLKIYNDNWIDEDHPALTAAEFMATLSLKSIVILDEPGFADLYFDDGDMFGGHNVAVSFTDAHPTSAQLLG